MALKNYLEMRGSTLLHAKEQLFIYHDHSPVQTQQFRNMLRKAIKNLGLDETCYDTHSFCMGRARDLFKFGASVEDIKQIGRWKSNSVHDYLR